MQMDAAIDAPGSDPSAPRDDAGPLADAPFPPFRPRFPWIGADLQTLRNRIRRTDWPSLGAWPGERLRFPMADGTGDELLALLNRPLTGTGPLVVLLHGLTGCEDSSYIRYSAAFWLKRGHPVLRLNLRGAGPSRGLCREHYHAGRTEDLRAVLDQLAPRWGEPGLLLVGYSLGANMMLKLLGETGTRLPILATASISAPIDLSLTSARMDRLRNWVYVRWFVHNLKAGTLASPGLSEAEHCAVAAVRTVRAFDQVFVAPRNGFADEEDYYAKCSAAQFLPHIRVPSLIIHARNDPWIPLRSYGYVDWDANQCLVPLLGSAGGHVGFHGRSSRTAWHDRCSGVFFDRISSLVRT